jgi:hypothetical protein
MIVNYVPNPVENGNKINSIISEYRAHHPANKVPVI